jgi:hypothetical protein
MGEETLGDWSANHSIFLQVWRMSEEYYLHERFVMSLHWKIFKRDSVSPRTIFTEDEILRTFNPILEALVQNLIPSFYQITSYNIVVDSHENVRLCNPLFAHSELDCLMDVEFDHYTQMAMVLLESTLLMKG